MDLASIIGILLGVAALLGGQLLEGGQIASILQPTAALIVFGGTAGATLLSTPQRDVRRGLNMIGDIFRTPRLDARQTAQRLISMAAVARKEGIIALEETCGRDPSPFVRVAMQRVIDGTNGKLLREVLETHVETRTEKDLAAAQVFETAGGYAPTLGILGAVLGLIHVMENLGDPSRLGLGIAVAFVATVYGVGFANLFLLPVASKLKRLAIKQRNVEEMVIEGALAIQSGQSPGAVADRLHAFFGRSDLELQT